MGLEDTVNEGFDSILVRLKEDNVSDNRTIRPTKFRFHTGSIKRSIYLIKRYPKQSVSMPHHKFRFHTGSIKRIWQGSCAFGSGSRFRFHTGSIKRKPLPRLFNSSQRSFDSILVRLKDLSGVDLENADLVSIPYWFD